MKIKQIIIGLGIFIIVTIVLFITFVNLLSISETYSALLAIAFGLICEIGYRKKIAK